MEINSSAKKSIVFAGISILFYLGVKLFTGEVHYHTDDGALVEGHEDHIHVVYQSVYEIDPSSITAITAYIPSFGMRVRIIDNKLIKDRIDSSCHEVSEWFTNVTDETTETNLSNREATELRNLYSNIQPDFRISVLQEGETYGLSNPEGCAMIESNGEQFFLQFGIEAPQGYSRYMRINRSEHIYLVPRYIYSTFAELIVAA